jgi:hypothetical protein
MLTPNSRDAENPVQILPISTDLQPRRAISSHIHIALNHRSVTHSTVTAIYARYRYDKEKRTALETSAKFVEDIIKPRSGNPSIADQICEQSCC